MLYVIIHALRFHMQSLMIFGSVWSSMIFRFYKRSSMILDSMCSSMILDSVYVHRWSSILYAIIDDLQFCMQSLRIFLLVCHHCWSLIPCAIIDDLRFHMWSWWSLIPYVMIYDSIRNHWRSLIPYVIDSISDHPWSLIPHAIINVLFCMRSECMYNRWDLKYNVHHNLKHQHSGQLSNSDFQIIFWPNIPLSLALVKL